MRTLAIALLAALGSQAAEPAWKAGVARAAITPREPIWLAGYAARTKPSEGVLTDIWAKALALQDGSGATSVLVSVEILGFSREMSAEIARRALERYKLPRERLILSATHTHSAPVTASLLQPAYPLDDAQRETIRCYTSWLLDQVTDVIGRAIADLAPARLEFEQGLAGFAVNRRRVGARARPGPVDHDVPVLAVRAPDGKLRAVLFGYACHPTVLADYVINGDYAGFAQQALESEYPGATAIFVLNTAADANPLPRRSVELARIYGRILAAAVREVLNGKMKPVEGPLRAALEYVDLPFQDPPSREQLTAALQDRDAMHRRWARLMLETLDREGRLPASYPCPVQVWQFRPSLTIIVLAGEVVVDYALRFKSQFGWDDTWVVGYSNDVFAYIPSLRVLREGGYEGGGAMIAYGQPAPFRESVEEIIAAKVQELVSRLRAAR
ncbi:MAG: neutral/alkaline non-lysosomal ceramidase N-terminal domain-containing protein [Bryobacteraceae bacterium]